MSLRSRAARAAGQPPRTTPARLPPPGDAPARRGGAMGAAAATPVIRSCRACQVSGTEDRCWACGAAWDTGRIT